MLADVLSTALDVDVEVLDGALLRAIRMNRGIKMRKYPFIRAMLAIIVFSCAAASAIAQTAPSLGTTSGYAVLAGQTVTNTGPTTITGDVGVSPGTAITGFPPGVISGGAKHSADAAALQAESDLIAAYGSLTVQMCNTDLTGQDLGGKTLTPGVYCFSSSAQLTGTLTLDAQGNSAAIFIFKIGSTLTTASNSKVVVINGGSDCNTFWQIGSSAVLGTTTSFAGNILALTSITLNTNATVNGRLLARNGAVTLDSNTVSVCSAACAATAFTPETLPAATVGVPYSQAITASGVPGPYAFAVSSGTLPSSWSLSSAGVLSGTATTSGTFPFGLTASTANNCSGIESITLRVSPGSVLVGTPSAAPALSAWAIALMLGALCIGTLFHVRRGRND